MDGCCVCGANNTERDTWRLCEPRHAFVCLQCCKSCVDYTKEFHYPGSHCRRQDIHPEYFLAPREEVNKYKEKYNKELSAREIQKYYWELREQHSSISNPQTRAHLRIKIRALAELYVEGKL